MTFEQVLTWLRKLRFDTEAGHITHYSACATIAWGVVEQGTWKATIVVHSSGIVHAYFANVPTIEISHEAFTPVLQARLLRQLQDVGVPYCG